MSTELNFDANSVKPSSPNDPIPLAWYKMAIVASEMKSTNDGKGKYLKLEFQALEGDYKGRKVWVQLNLQNPNETTVRIAQEQLSAICHATGVMKLSNSSQLHNIPMLCKVTIVPAKVENGVTVYEAKNDMKGWKAIDGTKLSGTAPTPATAPAAAAPSANAPAWAKKSA